jgi:hypothetical protein
MLKEIDTDSSGTLQQEKNRKLQPHHPTEYERKVANMREKVEQIRDIAKNEVQVMHEDLRKTVDRNMSQLGNLIENYLETLNAELDAMNEDAKCFSVVYDKVQNIDRILAGFREVSGQFLSGFTGHTTTKVIQSLSNTFTPSLDTGIISNHKRNHEELSKSPTPDIPIEVSNKQPLNTKEKRSRNIPP